jgi:hypothetical protein
MEIADRFEGKARYNKFEHDDIRSGCLLSEYTLDADYDILQVRALGLKSNGDRVAEYCASVCDFITIWYKVRDEMNENKENINIE